MAYIYFRQVSFIPPMKTLMIWTDEMERSRMDLTFVSDQVACQDNEQTEQQKGNHGYHSSNDSVVQA